jgi:hypothetical protein
MLKAGSKNKKDQSPMLKPKIREFKVQSSRRNQKDRSSNLKAKSGFLV